MGQVVCIIPSSACALFGVLGDPLSQDNVHNFGKTGNIEHFANFLRNIHYGKIVFAECFEMNKAYPQKGGGNKDHFVKVKDDLGIFMAIPKFSDTAQQFLLER